MRSLLARERRAQVETPVILIFAVVAGVLVLLVVGWFVLRQQESASGTRTLTHLRGIVTVIEGAGSTSRAAQNVTLIDTLRVECDETGLGLWYGRNDRLSIAGTIVFSEPSVRGVATVRSVPVGEAYRVGNAVFITSTKTAPGTAPFEPVGTYAIGGSSVVYFGPALYEGARISMNASQYECGLGETLKRYRFVNHVQRERIARLVQEYTASGSPCQYLYENAPFEAIEDVLSDDSGNTVSAATFDIASARTIVQAEERIRTLNDNLVRSSCATVS